MGKPQEKPWENGGLPSGTHTIEAIEQLAIEIVDLAIKNGDVPQFYVCLPECMQRWSLHHQHKWGFNGILCGFYVDFMGFNEETMGFIVDVPMKKNMNYNWICMMNMNYGL